MVLEAAGDIRSAERDLREIELLRSRGVEGAGTLEGDSIRNLDAGLECSLRLIRIEVISLNSNLASGIRAAQSRGRDLGAARKQVGELLMRYNDYVSCLRITQSPSLTSTDQYHVRPVSGYTSPT